MTNPSATRVGAFTVTTLLDGDFPCDPAFLPEAGSPSGQALFRGAGLPPAGPSHEPFNAFAIERDGALWLVDGGVGAEILSHCGRVPEALRALGRPPEAVETIVLTHLHEDHIGGLVTGGRKVYPNARLIVPEAELRFWTDPRATAASREPADTVERARAFVGLYDGAIEAVAGTRPFAPGLSFLPLHGHTPGHSGVLIEDDGDRLLMWGDTVHSGLLQLARPEWSIVRDNDPEQAVATRLALLADIAGSGLRVAGSHLVGVGRIERERSGFRLVPDAVPASGPQGSD